MQVFPCEISKRAIKELQRLDAVTKDRIEEKIKRLEADPFPQEVTRVENSGDEKTFRVRVGSYRILYIVRFDPKKIIIIKIDKRERVYD